MRDLLDVSTAESPPEATVRLWPARMLAPVATVVPAAAVAAMLGGGSFVFVALGAWAAVLLTRPTGARRTGGTRDQISVDVRLTAVVGGVLTVPALAEVVPLEAARSSLLVLSVAVATLTLVRRLQPLEVEPRRVVLVGGRSAVTSFAASGLGRDVLAGALFNDGQRSPGASPSQALQVPTATGLGSFAELVSWVRADVVLVLPYESSGAVVELAVPRDGTGWGTAVLDRCGAAALSLVTAPLLLLLWAAVRLDSRGSGFHVSTRVGRNGKPFRMVLLRTMHADAGSLADTRVGSEASSDVSFLIRRDPRVTRVGYWLRRSSLDRLPALLNVLRGEMSLRGPRAALPDEVAEYDVADRGRLAVKPGVLVAAGEVTPPRVAS